MNKYNNLIPFKRYGWLIFSLLLSFGVFPQQQLFAQKTILQVKTAYLPDGKVQSPCEIWIENGKIIEIKETYTESSTEQIIKAHQRVAVPGFVSSAGFYGHDGIESQYTVNWEQQAIDGVELLLPEMDFLRAGITTTYVAPGKNRLLNGFGSLVKTAGSPEIRTVKAQSDLHLHLSEKTLSHPELFKPPFPATVASPINPKIEQLPTSPMSAVACLQDIFLIHHHPPSLLPIDENQREQVLHFLKEKPLLRVQSDDPFYLHHSLRLATETGLPLLIERNFEKNLAEKELQKTPQILLFQQNWDEASKNWTKREEFPEHFCVAPPSKNHASQLLQEAMRFQQYGFTPSECLELITSKPASFLNVDHQIGSPVCPRKQSGSINPGMICFPFPSIVVILEGMAKKRPRAMIFPSPIIISPMKES